LSVLKGDLLMLDTLPLPAFDVPRATRALGALLKNPDDLPQVFTLIESISGTAPHRLFFGMKRRKTGARLLRDRPDIVPILSNREGLRALPAGSLGRAYLDFVESEGISPEGIQEACVEGEAGTRAKAFDYVHQRMRDTHDVWHAATGYKGDVVGELALLAFTLGQNWNVAIAMIVLGGIAKGLGRDHLLLILKSYRRGRKAEWLPAVDWESLLALPLEDVRARLKVGAPPEYVAVRTDQLRAEGVL
jgi:ubiquinone biosynthesis protein COQ4